MAEDYTRSEIRLDSLMMSSYLVRKLKPCNFLEYVVISNQKELEFQHKTVWLKYYFKNSPNFANLRINFDMDLIC